MILKKMKGQRRDHEPGDVFLLQLLRDDSFRYGRIIRLGETTKEARFPGRMLVYIYNVVGKTPEVIESELTPDRLLVPPLFTIPWMWNRGYFRSVAHVPLGKGMILAQHCFYSASGDCYVDEDDHVLDRRYEPCGWFSVANFETLDREIGKALDGNPVQVRHASWDG